MRSWDYTHVIFIVFLLARAIPRGSQLAWCRPTFVATVDRALTQPPSWSHLHCLPVRTRPVSAAASYSSLFLTRSLCRYCDCVMYPNVYSYGGAPGGQRMGIDGYAYGGSYGYGPGYAMSNYGSAPVPTPGYGMIPSQDTPMANSAAFEAMFRGHLAHLTFNSKPIITNLTLIAQESAQRMSTIVAKILDDHILMVSCLTLTCRPRRLIGSRHYTSLTLFVRTLGRRTLSCGALVS